MTYTTAPVSGASHVFPPVFMRGPAVKHSISLVQAAIITGDSSGVTSLSHEKTQCVVDVIHEVGYPKSIQGLERSSVR